MKNLLSIITHRISSIYLRYHRALFPGTTSYLGEFGFECLNAIPYAYALHRQNRLKKSTSVSTMSPFYYFSPNHKEKDIKRCYREEGYPKIPIAIANNYKSHRGGWSPPPYKKIYANKEYLYDKPTLVISNKYTTEWDSAPCNYLKLSVLEEIIEFFSDTHQIIYNRYLGEEDGSKQLELGDYQFIKQKYPSVLCMPDLHASSNDSYNLLQLKIYANCSKFISVQGGGSVLASYFGGKNCIYIKKGEELVSGEYTHHYPRLSNCKISAIQTDPSDIQRDHSSKYKTPYLDKDIDKEFIQLVKQELS